MKLMEEEDSGIRMRDFESQKTWIEAVVPNIVVIRPPEQERGKTEPAEEDYLTD